MKLRRVAVENVRSFLERQELQVPGDISIIIGPNGGGKTNLLDTAVLTLRHFLLKSWTPRHSPTADWQERYEWVHNDAINIALLEKNSAAQDKTQTVELDLELTKSDIDSIHRAKAEAAELRERSKIRYTSLPGTNAADWNTDGLKAGDVFTYRIVNGTLQASASPQAVTFQRFLETYEVSKRLREEFEKKSLSMPMISLPVNRTAGESAAAVTLASFNEYDFKRMVDAASSRSSGSIMQLAIGRLASRHRVLIEKDDGRARAEFNSDEGITKLTDVLKSLGYDWKIECTNPLTNQYDVRLSKQGSSFRLGSASSGERELLTYLFAVYALNVRDALIVVDEPELHLHPRWQKTLLSLFERLAKDTGNQFVLATHSPVFVSPASIQYVSRVYSDKQRSRIVRLGEADLPDPKHLFSIVNSQNNERLFFADMVVLVEGISDRIFFEALFKRLKVEDRSSAVYEIVSVGGKMLFSKYEQLLKACKIPYIIIADLDYVQQVGTPELRGFFTVSGKAIKDGVIDDHSSIDGATLVVRLDEAIATGNAAKLKELWEYIKARKSRLRADLNDVERAALDKFIVDLRTKGVYILRAGALEAYLPDGMRSKDLEKLIRLVSSGGFWEQLPASGRDELKDIVDGIKFA